MRFLTLNRVKKNINVAKYEINWKKESISKFQKGIKDFFHSYWKSHFCYEEFPCVGTRFRLDLVNLTKNIAVECHGEQHVKYNSFWHKRRGDFYDQALRDVLKKQWCEVNGIKLVEIYYDDVPLTEDWIVEKFGNIL